ncbi:Nucleotidylyl transferase [Thermothelomyces heterothallicus CBS 203.75]
MSNPFCSFANGSRLVADAEDRIYKDLRWAGLIWDEGPDLPGPYGPYRQSERLSLYKEHADKLVREGKAYRCFCSPEALEEQKKKAHEAGEPTLYPGTCRDLSLEESDDRAHRGEPFAIRFKSAEEPIKIQDLVYGRFMKNEPEDDYIIMKRDGFPTYHFANVVDDRHMKITHVIRGAEWLVSTPKHVELYQAFGWEPPQFAHVGLLADRYRQKLSKREDSANLQYYKDGHILPSALLNFVVLLGWRAPPTKGEFSLKFSKGDIVVSLQKLPFLQEKHLERLIEKEDKTYAEHLLEENHFIKPLREAIEKVQQAKDEDLLMAPGKLMTGEIGARLPAPRIFDERFRRDLLRLVTSRRVMLERPADRFVDAMWKLRYYIWEVPQGVLEVAVREGKLDPVAPADRAEQLSKAVSFLADKFRAVDEADWTHDGLGKVVKDIMGNTEYWEFFETSKNAQTNVYTPLRWALLALEKGLPITTTMEILGKEETLRRLEVAKSAAAMAAQPLGKP